MFLYWVEPPLSKKNNQKLLQKKNSKKKKKEEEKMAFELLVGIIFNAYFTPSSSFPCGFLKGTCVGNF